MKFLHIMLLFGLAGMQGVHGAETLKAYGPGGPAPAMKEAARPTRT